MSNRKGSKALPGGTEKANKGTVYEASSAYLFVASLPYQSFFETIKSAEKEITAELQLRSDQGFQYTSHGYFKLTQSYNIIPSMPSPVTPLDNACAENFFSTLKSDLLRRLNPESMENARTLIDDYIHFCNFERIQLKAKLTPFEKR